MLVRETPFHCTVEAPCIKFEPFTVSVKPKLPGAIQLGLKLPMPGTGLLIVRVCAFEVPPPGVVLNTVIAGVLPTAISISVIAAVSCVAETNVVVRLIPFQRIEEIPLLKFVPFTVSVNPAPRAVTEVGLILMVVGTGLFTVTLAVALLLPGVASVAVVVTLAVLFIVPVAVGVTINAIVALAPLLIMPRLQVTALVPVHEP